MKLKVQKTFNIEYTSKYEPRGEILIEADTMEEALDIMKKYKETIANDEGIIIKGIHSYRNIIKPISKTVSHTITIEL